MTAHQRFMYTDEMMALQGMNPMELDGWRDIVSDSQMGHIIGNAVPIPLMMRVLQMLFQSVGCLGRGP